MSDPIDADTYYSRGMIEAEAASTTFQMCVKPKGCHQSACATYLSSLLQTVGKHCTDVEAPIQTVTETVGKHGTDVQNVNYKGLNSEGIASI